MRKLFKWARHIGRRDRWCVSHDERGFRAYRPLSSQCPSRARIDAATRVHLQRIGGKGEVIAITRGCTDCHDDGMKGKVFLDIGEGLIVAPNLTKGRGDRYAGLQTPDGGRQLICSSAAPPRPGTHDR